MPTSGSLVLASASPRRKELLAQLGVQFSVQPVDVNESCNAGESPEICIQRLAFDKAKAGLVLHPDAVVIGSDTLVVKDGQILGKPEGREDGLRMLELLSGQQHKVMTAVTIMNQSQKVACLQTSDVRFRDLTRDEMELYWNTGEPADKAGGYAIQGLAASFICELRGSYSGVMGLPLYETAELLRQFGIRVLDSEHA